MAAEKDLNELFLDTLKDIYYAEKQILKALPKMAKAANSDKLRAAFEKHHDETEGQVERLEKIFELLGKAARGKKCDAIEGILDEGKEIMRWLAENVSKDIMVHIMEQYFPRAHVGKEKRGGKQKDGITEPGDVPASEGAKKEVRYADINRPVDLSEVASVKKAAEEAGIWRFVEAAKHGGFNI